MTLQFMCSVRFIYSTLHHLILNYNLILFRVSNMKSLFKYVDVVNANCREETRLAPIRCYDTSIERTAAAVMLLATFAVSIPSGTRLLCCSQQSYVTN